MSHLATVTETTGYGKIGKTDHDLSIGLPTVENRFPLLLKPPPPQPLIYKLISGSLVFVLVGVSAHPFVSRETQQPPLILKLDYLGP